MSEINVYVIENEQPFENWFGIWRFFTEVDGVYGFYECHFVDIYYVKFLFIFF